MVTPFRTRTEQTLLIISHQPFGQHLAVLLGTASQHNKYEERCHCPRPTHGLLVGSCTRSKLSWDCPQGLLRAPATRIRHYDPSQGLCNSSCVWSVWSASERLFRYRLIFVRCQHAAGVTLDKFMPESSLTTGTTTHHRRRMTKANDKFQRDYMDEGKSVRQDDALAGISVRRSCVRRFRTVDAIFCFPTS